MFGNGEGKQHIGDFCGGWVPLGNNFEVGCDDAGRVTALDQKTARDRAEGFTRRHRIRQCVDRQKPKVFLGSEDRFDTRL